VLGACASNPIPESVVTVASKETILGGHELVFPRTPSLSPDASQVAFGHQGDVWVASVATGQARRLTAHDAYDGNPKWSPDGNSLAFTSNRFGNRDVFIIPAQGGVPQRVTQHSESESVHGWIDENQLLVGATRERWYARRGQGAWVGHRDGRTPSLLVDEAMLRPAVRPHGEAVVYERGHGDPRRRAYRGTASSALWVWEADSGHRELTVWEGNDLDPMWSPSGNEVYFLSDRPCVGNEDGRELGLWKVASRGGSPEVVFCNGDTTLRTAEISADGSAVVGEYGDGILMVDVLTGRARELPVFGSYDPSIPEQTNKTVSSGVEDFSVSPDGESIAFVSQGDVFVMRNHKKIRRCVRVTTNPAPDSNPVWVDEGKALLFVSERDGNSEVYRVSTSDEEIPFYQERVFELERLTMTPMDEHGLDVSPDGQILAWIRGAGELVVGNPATLEVQRTLLNGFDRPSFSWSPDSRWMAWSVLNDDFNSDVFLAPVDGSQQPWNLTRHPDDDVNPIWSPDGRKLVFTSKRQMLDETDVWVAWLRAEDAERTERERLEAEEQVAQAKKKSKDEPVSEEKDSDEHEESEEDSDEDDSEEELVVIDFEDLPLRVERLTSMEGSESAIGWNADSTKVFFNIRQGTRLTTGNEGETGFHEVDLWEKETKKLESSSVSYTQLHEKEVFYSKSGKLYSRGSKESSHPFSVRVRIDRKALRQAVMEEGWRALDRGFYDPNFHGHDWGASLAKWKPIAMAASTPEDFGDIMNWMLGEMNASHMGYRGGGSSGPKETDTQSTPSFGVIWEASFDGEGRRVAEVLKGTAGSRADSRLLAGDVLTAINGMEYERGDNWAELVQGLAGQEVELQVSRGGEELSILMRPDSWSSMRPALYRRHVERSRAEVEKASGGRLGYIHIEGMGTSSLLEFERDLFRAGHDKDALLIDVRENGGGWTTDMVLAMLSVRDHAITIPRGGGKGYPQGRRVFATWDKPVVVLCNENSYSNAEIFSWSIKTLGRGPVVGKETYGAVISTGAAFLQDGSYVRMPFRGWYVNDDALTNMELNGCPPDHPVENLPGDFAQGVDRQLEKAIEVGLELL